MNLLPRRVAALVFLAFAFSYFFSALIRAITATLSPTLTQEFALNARDLGLLAGGYFLGFAATQLPLGRWLDRHGPKRVLLSFLTIAVLGCLAFSWATSFSSLMLARVLCGVGVSACLMAPLTGYRHWFSAPMQLRANSWMLMAGSLGMVASTLPVQWLVPVLGWRPLFVGLAVLVLLAMVMIAWQVPSWQAEVPSTTTAPQNNNRYSDVWRHPYFRKMAPVGFFNYGGLIAIQTLWAAPWMIQVAGYTADQAASGLFWINVVMLGTYWVWGLANPYLLRRGWQAEQIIRLGLPLSFVLLVLLIMSVGSGPQWAVALLTLYCMSCTVVALAQPAVGLAFPSALAGRALSAYNLVIFLGVFAAQWGIGLMIDGFRLLGWTQVLAYQAAMALFLSLNVASYLYFLLSKSHNQSQDVP